MWRNTWRGSQTAPSAIGLQALGLNALIFPIETFKEKYRYIIGFTEKTEVRISFDLDLYQKHRILHVV